MFALILVLLALLALLTEHHATAAFLLFIVIGDLLYSYLAKRWVQKQ